jgi:hypothetical protein
MRDLFEDALGSGPRAMDPNSTLRKFMEHVAPYVPTAMYLLGLVLIIPGIVNVAYAITVPGAWGLMLLGTYSFVIGLLCFPFGMGFREWQNGWWPSLEIATKRHTTLPTA